jgi:hypothetical protein
VHTGPGGWRSVPQALQRWMSSLPARAPSQKKRVSSLMPGAGRLIFGGPDAALASAAGFTGLAGLNLKTRNS